MSRACLGDVSVVSRSCLCLFLVMSRCCLGVVSVLSRFVKKISAKTEDLLHHLNLKQKSPHFTKSATKSAPQVQAFEENCNQKCKPLKKVEAKVQAFEKSAIKSSSL